MTLLGVTPARERAIWLFLAIASAVPFMVAPLPILPDLFSHIGRYHVMNNEADPWLSQYYAFDWHITGNLGFDLLMVVFGPLMGTEKAAYFLAACIPPLMVLGLYRLAKAVHGYVPAATYVALPLIWSFTFNHGFVNYWLGIALVFHVVAGWIGVRDGPAVARHLYAFAMGLLVWLCHTSAWGVLGLVIAGLEYVRRTSLRGFVGNMLPWASPIIPMMVWRVTKGSGVLFEKWLPMEKIYGIPNLLRAEWQIFDNASITLLLMAVVWLQIDKRFTRNAGLRLAALALLVTAFVLPALVLSSYFADVRLYAPMLMVALLAISGLPKREAALVGLAGAALFLLRIGETSIGWMMRGAEMEADLKALDRVPMGARIAVLAHSSECGVWPLAGRNHAPSLAIVRRHAFVNTEWDIPGQHLMKPIYNDVHGFNDSRTVDLFNPAFGCPGFRVRRFLREVPRDRFDYIWMWETEAPAAALSWLTPIYTGPTSRLYAIRHETDSTSGVELSGRTPK